MSAAARAEARFVEPLGRPVSWTRQAVGTFVAAQKILLDLTAQQNAMVIGLIRERVRIPSINPGPRAARAARKGVKASGGAGRLLLDLAASETALLAEAVKEGFRLAPAASTFTSILSHRIDTVIEDLKRLIDAVSRQIISALDSYLGGKGLTPEAGVAELVRQGIIGFVEVEKRFLDLVVEEVNMAVEHGRNGKKPVRPRNLSKLARQAVEEFIETQKKLLDLAIEQFDQPEPAVEEKRPEKHTSLAELTQRSVQNLVTAQKSLLELAVKPIRPSAAGKPAREAAKRTARKRKAA
jgi:hypothetical protein